MKLTKYCLTQCEYYSDKCKELETEADVKWNDGQHHGFDISDSLCWCCKYAGFGCRKWEWAEIPAWVTIRRTKNIDREFAVKRCERFKRG